MENDINFNFISKSKLSSIRVVLQVAGILLLFSMLIFASVTNYSVVFLIFSILILPVCVFLDIEDVLCLYIMLIPFNGVINAGGGVFINLCRFCGFNIFDFACQVCL